MMIKISRLKHIIVRQCGSNKSKGLIFAGSRYISCALGRSGISTKKREGDGATPVGTFRILYGFYRADRVLHLSAGISLLQNSKTFGWCDEPGDRNYNRLVKLPYSGRHEKLWREDHLYDYCLVLDQNYSKRMRGMGSAIFFHIASEDFKPTEGCVAIKLSDMRWLLQHIGRDTKLVIRL